MVMRIARTPSLNASSRFLFTPFSIGWFFFFQPQVSVYDREMNLTSNQRLGLIFSFALVLVSGCSSSPEPSGPKDPYVWLEPIQNPKVMEWVQKHNAKTSDQLALDNRYPQVSSDVRAIITADDRIPMPIIVNGMITNFWQDREHVRGILRRTTFAEYQKKNPKWETLLDIDALNKAEKKSWVYHGENCLPGGSHCIVFLSDAGRDETEVREFDQSTKTFVADGFRVAPAKTELTWLDLNHLLIATNFGPESLTTSGYPRTVRLWTRGTKLGDSPLVYEGKKEDISIGAETSFHPDSPKVTVISNEMTTWESKHFLYTEEGTLKQLPFPIGVAYQGNFAGHFIAKLREDWKPGDKNFPAGSLVSLPLSAAGNPDAASSAELVYTPDSRSAFHQIAFAKDAAYLDILKDVHGEIYKLTRDTNGKGWSMSRLPFPDKGTTTIVDTDNFDDRFFVNYQTFTVPSSLYLGTKKIKTLSEKFDAKGITFDQFHATSSDGTQIPYYVVHPKHMMNNGKNPTLLYAYGGFEVSYTPFYMGAIGKIWLEKGGVYVLANIRGGGEFGPKWHEAVIKEHRQLAYDDFAAVAQDLIKRKITSSQKLAIQGGSNGGLLMGVQFTQHPELYKAVICESALLDMLRYTKLPPGASWMGEYGDPEDPATAAYIGKYSPYQNIKPDVKYPEVFFHTSTADDRVQPGHTRKVVARLEEFGNPVLLYENTEGGHGGAADLEQRVKKTSLEYIYLYQKLMNN